MSIAQAARLHEEPVDVTPERQERLTNWAVSYALDVRATWAANGEDITTDEAKYAVQLVAASMTVPERETWMPLGRAMLTLAGVALAPPTGELDPTSDAAIDLRDALRTRRTATEDEVDHALASHLGISEQQARSLRERVPGIDDETPARGRTALYRHFAVDDELLYIGIAVNPRQRAEQHQRNSAWAPLSARMEVEWFDTRADAEAAERHAIPTEAPLFNVTHNKKHRDKAVNYLLARLTSVQEVSA